MEIAGFTLSGTSYTLFWVLIAFLGVSFVLSIGIGIMYIYYSWIRKENSKNWTGENVTRHMLDEGHLKDVKIKKTFLMVKYWNYNKRRKTHSLRPWTANRRSIWTIMEAAHQAYATTIRSSKGKTFWLLFRVPGLLRFIGAIAGGALSIYGASSVDNWNDLKVMDWFLLATGISIIFISFMVAECGKLWILYRNVPQILEKAGFNMDEVSAVKRIYLWRFLYSLVVVIIEIIRLIIRISIESKNKSN